MLFKQSIISSYDKLLNKKQYFLDKMSNIGREKDYRVQKIEKKYEAKIDALIRKEQSCSLQIEISKKYLDKN